MKSIDSGSKRRQSRPMFLKRNLLSFKKELKELKSKKSKAVDAALESVSSNVQKSGFRLSIKQNARPNRKTVYCVNDVAESYFVVKQLQFILYKIYKIKQSNRDHLVCQLRELLEIWVSIFHCAN